MKYISATEARVRFGELLRGVEERNETYVVERAGRPKAVILSLDELKRRTSGQSRRDPRAFMDELKRFHQEVQDDLHGTPLPDFSEIIRQAREERGEALLDTLPRREPRDPTDSESGRNRDSRPLA